MRPTALILLAALTAPAVAQAPEPALTDETAAPPVCSRPNVLHAIRERLSHAGQPAVLDEQSVGQISLGPDRVACAIRVHMAVYDTDHAGRPPLDAASTYQYTLELRRNGVFLLPSS